nr:hypothetical protein [Tanacetum cinerariifolium]
MPFSTYTNLSLEDLAHTRLTVELANRTLRVAKEKIVFKSIKPSTSIIRRVYMLKGRMNHDFKTKLIGEAVNKSFDPHYGDYIELNDLDMPLEPRMNQDNNFEPTIDESIIVDEPSNKCCYKMKFSCMNRFNSNEDEIDSCMSIPSLRPLHYSDRIPDTAYSPVEYDLSNFLYKYIVLIVASISLKKEAFRDTWSCRIEFTQIRFIYDIEERLEKEATEVTTEIMEQLMSKTREDYGSGVTRTKIKMDTHFELKGQFLKELRDNTFSASKHEDANEHIEKVLEIVDLFHIPNITQDQIMLRAFSISLTGAASCWLRNEPTGGTRTKDSRNLFNWTTLHDNTLPQKEKDPGSFTLPCFIHNVCFDKALFDLGESVSVMPFSTYTNLSFKDLAHTRLTVELVDRVIKNPRGIAKNMLVRIGKFIFPLDFIILDIPEDDDVPLILERTFLSTAHAKIDAFKRKITLRVGEEKIVSKSIKPATSIIRRVYMLKERTNLNSKTKLIGEAVDKSFDPHNGDYIELNDLDMPLEPRMNQANNFEPTIDESVIVDEHSNKCCYKMKFSCMNGYKHVRAGFLTVLSVNMMNKCFYNSIIKDKVDHEGKKLAKTFIDIPIFVKNFSTILGFTIIDDMYENVTSGVVLSMSFCKKFVSCQKIMEKFSRKDECEQIKDE